jgi:hypothetical protein
LREHEFGNRRALIFLQKMAGVPDRGVRHVGSPGNAAAQRPIRTTGDWVTVSKTSMKRS